MTARPLNPKISPAKWAVIMRLAAELDRKYAARITTIDSHVAGRHLGAAQTPGSYPEAPTPEIGPQ